MENRELIEELLKEQRKTTKYQKVAAITCICIAVILAVAAIFLVPRTIKTLDNVNEVMGASEEMIANANEAIDAIDTAARNVDSTVSDIDAALEDLETAVGDAKNVIAQFNDAVNSITNFLHIGK